MYFTLTGHPGTWHYFTKKLWAHYWIFSKVPLLWFYFFWYHQVTFCQRHESLCHVQNVSWLSHYFSPEGHIFVLQDFSHKLINHWGNGCQGSEWIMTLTCDNRNFLEALKHDHFSMWRSISRRCFSTQRNGHVWGPLNDLPILLSVCVLLRDPLLPTQSGCKVAHPYKLQVRE